VLDLVGGRRARPSADRLVAAGVIAALPTAAAGLAELADVADEPARRIGAAHAIGNGAATTLYALSWRARRRDRRLRGLLLSFAGAGVATASGYLGAHLGFRLSVGVEACRIYALR
jgi:uncharacterized membrane protein